MIIVWNRHRSILRNNLLQKTNKAELSENSQHLVVAHLRYLIENKFLVKILFNAVVWTTLIINHSTVKTHTQWPSIAPLSANFQMQNATETIPYKISSSSSLYIIARKYLFESLAQRSTNVETLRFFNQ